MCGAWWLCREIELASQRARLLEFELISHGDGGGRLWKASLHLPASKTDLQAAGVSRSLVCSCVRASSASSSSMSSSSRLSSSSCVVHAFF